MKEWKKYKIDELAEILNNKRIPLNSRERTKMRGIYPYYGASGIVDYVDDYIFTGEHVLISEDGENLRSRNTPIAFKADEKFWVNNHAHIVKGRKTFINDWLVYFFALLDLTPYITGAVQPKLSKENLLSIPIPYPGDEKAHRIISILKSLDDKIELNRRMNQTLEQIAATLFRKYFVNDIDALTKEVSLFDIANLLSGGTPKTSVKEFWDGSIHWISAKDVTPNDKSFILDTERKITPEGLNKSAAKLLPSFSTVITARGTVGSLCLIPVEMAISQSNYALKSKIDGADFFLFQLMQYKVEELQQNSYGTVFDTITTNTLRELKVQIPPMEMIMELESELKPLYLTILNNLKENKTLSQIRDTLLPKLMLGEIDLSAIHQNEALHADALS